MHTEHPSGHVPQDPNRARNGVYLSKSADLLKLLVLLYSRLAATHHKSLNRKMQRGLPGQGRDLPEIACTSFNKPSGHTPQNPNRTYNGVYLSRSAIFLKLLVPLSTIPVATHHKSPNRNMQRGLPGQGCGLHQTACSSGKKSLTGLQNCQGFLTVPPFQAATKSRLAR